MYLVLMMNTFHKYVVQPCYANIFMAELEEDSLSGYPHKPLAYYRYIDDIFIIWSQCLHLLHNLINGINKLHSNVIFTSNISTTSVNILDVTFDHHGGHISPKTYTKSTDTRISFIQQFPP